MPMFLLTVNFYACSFHCGDRGKGQRWERKGLQRIGEGKDRGNVTKSGRLYDITSYIIHVVS